MNVDPLGSSAFLVNKILDWKGWKHPSLFYLRITDEDKNGFANWHQDLENLAIVYNMRSNGNSITNFDKYVMALPSLNLSSGQFQKHIINIFQNIFTGIKNKLDCFEK